MSKRKWIRLHKIEESENKLEYRAQPINKVYTHEKEIKHNISHTHKKLNKIILDTRQKVKINLNLECTTKIFLC